MPPPAGYVILYFPLDSLPCNEVPSPLMGTLFTSHPSLLFVFQSCAWTSALRTFWPSSDLGVPLLLPNTPCAHLHHSLETCPLFPWYLYVPPTQELLEGGAVSC